MSRDGDPAGSFPDGCPNEEVVCARDGPVAVLTFNRPQSLNAISPGMEAEFHHALDVADADASVRAIVVTGEGRAFSSGYDFGAETEPDTEAERLKFWWQLQVSGRDRYLHLMELGTPVLAAVRGWCLGGGFWYALSADITIAGDDAVFGQPEVREFANSTILFALLAGWKNAYRYSLTGDHFDAAEALRLGLVNEVVPADRALGRAVELAQRIALVPPDSVRMNKALTFLGLEALGLRAAMRNADLVSVIIHGSHDSPDLDELRRIRREQGMRASLAFRDDRFRPEPGGPRSRAREVP